MTLTGGLIIGWLITYLLITKECPNFDSRNAEVTRIKAADGKQTTSIKNCYIVYCYFVVLRYIILTIEKISI